jgi:hypothetical protein
VGVGAATSAVKSHLSPNCDAHNTIKARPIVNVCSEEAVSFFTDIIYRFGIPNTIIAPSSQGRNFSTSTMTTTSVWTGLLLLTRRQTNKLRG